MASSAIGSKRSAADLGRRVLQPLLGRLQVGDRSASRRAPPAPAAATRRASSAIGRQTILRGGRARRWASSGARRPRRPAVRRSAPGVGEPREVASSRHRRESRPRRRARSRTSMPDVEAVRTEPSAAASAGPLSLARRVSPPGSPARPPATRVRVPSSSAMPLSAARASRRRARPSCRRPGSRSSPWRRGRRRRRAGGRPRRRRAGASVSAQPIESSADARRTSAAPRRPRRGDGVSSVARRAQAAEAVELRARVAVGVARSPSRRRRDPSFGPRARATASRGPRVVDVCGARRARAVSTCFLGRVEPCLAARAALGQKHAGRRRCRPGRGSATGGRADSVGPSSNMEPSSLYDRNGRYVSSAARPAEAARSALPLDGTARPAVDVVELRAVGPRARDGRDAPSRLRPRSRPRPRPVGVVEVAPALLPDARALAPSANCRRSGGSREPRRSSTCRTLPPDDERQARPVRVRGSAWPDAAEAFDADCARYAPAGPVSAWLWRPTACAGA